MGIIKGGEHDETLDHLSISRRPVLGLFGALRLSEPAMHMSDASSNMNPDATELDSMSPADVAMDDNDSGELSMRLCRLTTN